MVADEPEVRLPMSPETVRGIRLFVLKTLIGLPAIGVATFCVAGTWHWPAAWLFLSLLTAATVANIVLLARTNPTLLAERARGVRGVGLPWDRVLVTLGAGLLPVATWLAAALQLRLGSGAVMAPGMQAAGVVAFGCAWALILWAMGRSKAMTCTRSRSATAGCRASGDGGGPRR